MRSLDVEMMALDSMRRRDPTKSRLLGLHCILNLGDVTFSRFATCRSTTSRRVAYCGSGARPSGPRSCGRRFADAHPSCCNRRTPGARDRIRLRACDPKHLPIGPNRAADGQRSTRAHGTRRRQPSGISNTHTLPVPPWTWHSRRASVMAVCQLGTVNSR